MTYKPSKPEVERIRDAAMKIIAECGVAIRLRMPGKVEAETTAFRRAVRGRFAVVYVPEPGTSHHHHIRIVRVERAHEPLAKIDWDDFGGVRSWPLSPGDWQEAFVAEANRLRARNLN